MFSQRSGHPSTPNALTLALKAHRQQGRPLLDLTVSNPTRTGLPYPSEAILKALSRPEVLTYTPESFGLMSAREAAARTFPVALSPERLVITASTSEAYAFLFKLLADPGGELLVPEPSYPLFAQLAAFEGLALKPYPLAYDGLWHIQPEAVAQAISPKTRGVLVVSPNNPTGSYLKRGERDALLDLGLPLISDEVFAPFPLEPCSDGLSTVLTAERGLVFALSGLSKLAGLPQLKAGWIGVGGEPALVEEALARLELIADTFLSCSTPTQVALPTLLASAHLTADAIRARTRANLTALRQVLADTPVEVLRVEGGWYALLALPRVMEEERYVRIFLEEDSVWVQPGYFYDFPREAYAVVSLLTPEAVLVEGANRIGARVKRLLA